MSPTSLGGGEQTLTAGEHISQLVETLIGRFFFLKKKNLNNGVIIRIKGFGQTVEFAENYSRLRPLFVV